MNLSSMADNCLFNFSRNFKYFFFFSKSYNFSGKRNAYTCHLIHLQLTVGYFELA